MISVDLWEKQEPRAGVEGAETYEQFNHEDNYRRFSAFCQNHFADRVDIMRMDTHSAARFIPDASLDFVFIDADHTYEGCRRDIEDWTCKIRPGGILSGHDINWPTVRQAVNEKFPQFLIFSDNVWAVPR